MMTREPDLVCGVWSRSFALCEKPVRREKSRLRSGGCVSGQKCEWLPLLLGLRFRDAIDDHPEFAFREESELGHLVNRLLIFPAWMNFRESHFNRTRGKSRFPRWKKIRGVCRIHR